MNAPSNDPDLPSDAVVYDVDYTDAHVIELWRRAQQCRRGSRWFMLIFRIVAGLILAGLILLVLYLGTWRQWYLAAVLLGILCVLIFSGHIEGWLLMRRWRNSPFRDTRSRMMLTAEGMHVDSKFSQGVNKWASYTKAWRFSDGFLLSLDSSQAYWFPHTRLVQGTPEAAASLIKKNVADYQEA